MTLDDAATRLAQEFARRRCELVEAFLTREGVTLGDAGRCELRVREYSGPPDVHEEYWVRGRHIGTLHTEWRGNTVSMRIERAGGETCQAPSAE